MKKELIWYKNQNNSKKSVLTKYSLDFQYKISLIAMLHSEYWEILSYGASDMADLTGVVYKTYISEKETVEGQVKEIQEAVNEGASALLIGAIDPIGISDAIREAKAKGVKIIYVDAPANEEAVITLATNNYNAGRIAGETMISKLGKIGIRNGLIGLVGVNTKIKTTMDREKGFNDVFRTEKQFKLLNTVYTEGVPLAAKEATESMIYYNNDLVGIFAVNEGCTIGMGYGIESADRKVLGIGFDLTDEIRTMIENKILKAVLVQNPYTMGYLGMAEAIAALMGKDTGPSFLNTGVSLAD